MKKPSKSLKKSARPAKPKPAKRRAFPCEKVAELWSLEKSIAEIAKAIGRVRKGRDPFHALRVSLTKMHKGHKNAEGNTVKLPHRVKKATLLAATKAGRRAKA